MIALLLAPLIARAGSYSAPVYSSSGQVTITDSTNPNSPVKHPYTQSSPADSVTGNLTYGGGGNDSCGPGPQGQSNSFSVAAAGAIIAKFTWQPASGQTAATDPPPAGVVVVRHCQADWLGGGSGTFSGAWDSGLGPSGTALGGPYATLYTGQAPAGDGSVMVTCSPSASINGASGASGSVSGGAGVTYSAGVSPVTVNPGGALNPLTAPTVLTGQQITASLSSTYSADSSTYLWSSTGDVFRTYNETAPSHQLVLLSDDPSYTNQSTFPFYDKTAEKITITCNATLVAPDGTRLPVTAKSLPITVMKPSVMNWGIAEGYVQYSPNYAGTGRQTYGLYGDLNGSSTATNGMIWSGVTVKVPQPFSGGLGTFTQLVNPNRLQYVGNNSTPGVPNNGILGLDGSFEYGSPWNVTAQGNDVDSPTQIVGATGQPQTSFGYTKLSDTDALTTYVMYQPSGGVWVPLQKFSWTWGVTLTWQTNQCNLTASYPAALGQAPPPTPTDTSDPPQWTVVH